MPNYSAQNAPGRTLTKGPGSTQPASPGKPASRWGCPTPRLLCRKATPCCAWDATATATAGRHCRANCCISPASPPHQRSPSSKPIFWAAGFRPAATRASPLFASTQKSQNKASGTSWGYPHFDMPSARKNCSRNWPGSGQDGQSLQPFRRRGRPPIWFGSTPAPHPQRWRSASAPTTTPIASPPPWRAAEGNR